MTTRSWVFALIALVTSSSVVAPASALECLAPQPLAGHGVLKETPAQIEKAGEMLSSGDAGEQAETIIADLRNRYPKAENAEIVNYIITAYCPVIAQTATLSELEKKAKMDQFVHQLMQKIY